MEGKKNDIRELTFIALGVAVIIGGGFGILQLSMVFPIPGVKYILMAPFLSMMFLLVQVKVNRNYTLLKLGTVFGLIMLIMNVYMGVTIILTSLLSQITTVVIPANHKVFGGSVLFSMYTGLSALLISKYFIGGVFEQLSLGWIFVTGMICSVSGFGGAMYGKKILRYLSHYRFEAKKGI